MSPARRTAAFPKRVSRKRKSRQFAFPKTVRGIALICIFAIPTIAIILLIWRHYLDQSYAKKTVIAIARFEGPNDTSYRIDDIIIERLHSAMDRYNDFVVYPLREAITDHSSYTARAKGKQCHASLLVWGWYAKTQERVMVTVHIEVLAPNDQLPFTAGKETFLAGIASLENFTLPIQLSNDVSRLALLTIGLARLNLKDSDGAISRFNDALVDANLKVQMTNPYYLYLIYFSRGMAFLSKYDALRAISDYDNAISLLPDSAIAYVNRGVAYMLKRSYDMAIVDFSKAIKLKPDYDDAYINRAIAHLYNNQCDQTIADCNRAIDLNPSNANAYSTRGGGYSCKRECDRAIADCDQAIRVSPDFGIAYCNRSSIYLLKGDYDRALADCNEAIKLGVNNARVYLNRSCAYASKLEYDRAIADCTIALTFGTSDFEAFVNRGGVYSMAKKYNPAIEDLNQAVRIGPDQAIAYFNRGNVYALTGDHSRAISDFDRVISYNPEEASAFFNRGQAWRDMGERGRAISDFKEAVILSKHPKAQPTSCERGMIDLFSIATGMSIGDAAMRELNRLGAK
jgi:tetratricopeptide (TPR) repeat protein